MERGYLVITVTAPKGTEALTFQCFVAETEEWASRLQVDLKSLRDRHGMRRIELEKQWDTGGSAE